MSLLGQVPNTRQASSRLCGLSACSWSDPPGTRRPGPLVRRRAVHVKHVLRMMHVSRFDLAPADHGRHGDRRAPTAREKGIEHHEQREPAGAVGRRDERRGWGRRLGGAGARGSGSGSSGGRSARSAVDAERPRLEVRGRRPSGSRPRAGAANFLNRLALHKPHEEGFEVDMHGLREVRRAGLSNPAAPPEATQVLARQAVP